MFPLSQGMFRRIIQFLAVCIMVVLTVVYLFEEGYFAVLSVYWRETLFASVGIMAGWLFAVTHGLRPVVAIFAATAFFVIAKMDDPSGESILAAIEGIGDRVLAVADEFTQG